MDQKINELKKEMSKDTMRAVLTLQVNVGAAIATTVLAV